MTLKMIVDHFILKENREKALKIYQEMVAYTRKEKGCILYDLHEDIDVPGHFIYIEEWESQKDIDSHNAGYAFKELFPKLMSLSTTGTDHITRIKKLL